MRAEDGFRRCSAGGTIAPMIVSNMTSRSRDFELGAGTDRAVRRALANLERRQGDDGAWAGAYGGPMFLLPMYLALCHAAKRPPSETQRARMIAYFERAQNEDGSVGIHAEDPHGSLFCSALVYVALRMLGVPRDDARARRMLAFVRRHGSPLAAAQWAKVTLSLVGLYRWDGLTPLLPELWLLPYATPFHPARLWCHCRQVYLPMSWLYGRRASIADDDLIQALREELYDGAWSSIEWTSHRDTVAQVDAYRPPSRLLALANAAQRAVERITPDRVREMALGKVREHIAYEDEVTNFIDIGPVNKVLNAFVAFFDDPKSEAFERAFAICENYLFDNELGTMMQGYNSSKLWDVAFATQAIASTPTGNEHRSMLERAYGYVRDNQILDDVPRRKRFYRDASRGGWPFSNRAHGWPITDCTAEGLKCALALEGRFSPRIPEPLLRDAVTLILDWQNDDGGWATYEKRRGGAWLEKLNPSQVFGDIMVDYSYVECTSACMQALRASLPRFGRRLAARSRRAIAKGERFLRSAQRRDGSFEGSWGVCFTYGTWFGVTGLLAAGAQTSDPAIRAACDFLLAHQRSDGGWGEDGDSCRERRYVPSDTAGVVQTSWALSTLVRANHPNRPAKARAAKLLVDRQEADGSWAREPLVGVFNKTCLIDYDNYRHYFPLWALAEFAREERAR